MSLQLENFIRDAAVTYWHESGTVKMGRDAKSVVDANLKVYGIDNLRLADGSVMPASQPAIPGLPVLSSANEQGDVLRQTYKTGMHFSVLMSHSEGPSRLGERHYGI